MPRKVPPTRGQIIWLDFDPAQGHEQKGHRPALVLSHEAFNQAVGTALVCAMTSSSKAWPYKVEVEKGSYALADQIRTIDWEQRPWKPKGHADPEVVDHIFAILEKLMM